MTNNIFQFPECIFLTLQSFLSHKEYRNTLNSCKKDYFLRLKKKSCCYYLSPVSTSRYLSDASFQNQILSLIERPEKQLGINVHALQPLPNLGKFREISSIKNLNVLFAKVSFDFSIFCSSQRLIVTDCDQPLSLNGLISIVDLYLKNFSKLSDISGLSNCRALTKVCFSSCYKLTNINSLAHVEVIEIEACPINDAGIANLGGSLQYLKLDSVSDVTNLNHLYSLKKLHVCACKRLKSISGLLMLKDLGIWNCPNLPTYSYLPALQNLLATGDHNFHLNYSDSLQVKQCFLYGSIPIEPVKLMNFVSLELLNLTFNKNDITLDLNCLSQLASLKVLDIDCMTQNQQFNIHLFQNVRWISLKQCQSFEGIIEPMPNLRTLLVLECDKLRSLSGLEGNRRMKLKIKDCQITPALSLFSLLMNGIESLVYDVYYSVSRVDKQIEELSSTMKPTSYGEIPNKMFQFSSSMPFQFRVLKSLFASLHMLILFDVKDFVWMSDLRAFAEAGIHKIPVLYMIGAERLQSLYPSQFIPQHERLILENCPYLWNLAGIENVKSVSISNCESLVDIRRLAHCNRIQFKKATSQDPLGFQELQDRIEEPVQALEFELMESIFDRKAMKQHCRF